MNFTPARLKAALDECLAAAGPARPTRLCVALSGGLDSTVLLTALAQLRDRRLPGWDLRAVHVDHGLHADSADWSAQCRHLADGLGVAFDEVRVDARPADGESPEAAAREARYAALAGRLAAGEALLTAHHADDQLETILLQWLRGGGLRAVAGMPACAPIAAGWHLRPLLRFTRADLEQWARQSGLAWLEDPSNRDRRFDRNYLRHAVLPAIRDRWPAAARTAGRVADYAREAIEAEEATASADLEQVAEGAVVSLARLQALPDTRQRAVLRAWLRRLGLPLPSVRTMAALRRDLVVAAADRNPVVDWPGVAVRRYRGRLYAGVREAPPLGEGEWPIDRMPRFVLGDSQCLELVPAVGSGLSRERLPGVLSVIARADGEEYQPAGTAHRRPLRKWFQEQGVLPWQRDRLPLLAAGGEIVAVADISCAAAFAARPGEPSLRVVWHGRPAVTESDAISFNWQGPPPIR